MPDIFLSYAHDDSDIAKALAAEFRARGLDVWWDEDLRAGNDWAGEIMGTLDTIRLVVVLWSPSSTGSEWVSLEAGYALVKKKLVPVRIAPVETPSPFRSVQEADLTGWVPGRASQRLDRLVSTLKQRLALLGHRPDEEVVRRDLAQLRQGLRLGSRLLVAGLLTVIPLTILSGLIWAHFEAVLHQQIAPAMPANFAVSGSAQVILSTLTGALGWTAWLYLRSAAKLQHRLEFQLGAARQQIADALAGSSLVSTSSAFVKLLCFAFCVAATIASVPFVAALSVSLLSRHHEYYNASSLVFEIGVLLPYFVIASVTQLRWFNPSSWDLLPGLLRRYVIRDTRRQFDEMLIEMLNDDDVARELGTDEVATLRSVLYEAAESVWSSVDAELATAHRRLGTLRFLRQFFAGTLYEDVVYRVLSIELWKTVDRTLPDRSPEERLRILLRFFS